MVSDPQPATDSTLAFDHALIGRRFPARDWTVILGWVLTDVGVLGSFLLFMFGWPAGAALPAAAAIVVGLAIVATGMTITLRRRQSEDFQQFERFATIGWTETDWRLLRHELQADHRTSTPGAPAVDMYDVLHWLFDPPYPFTAETRITPDTVRDAIKFGNGAVPALNGYIVGAPGPFVEFLLAMPRPSGRIPDIRATWCCLHDLHIDEDAAIGWAATGLFTDIFRRSGPALTDETALQGVLAWVDTIGQGAWLWVLAGFTLDEVVALDKTGTVITEQQLRVMAVLNGHTLPAGT